MIFRGLSAVFVLRLSAYRFVGDGTIPRAGRSSYFASRVVGRIYGDHLSAEGRCTIQEGFFMRVKLTYTSQSRLAGIGVVLGR